MNKKVVALVASATVVTTIAGLLVSKNDSEAEENKDNIYLNKYKKYDVTSEVKKSLSRIDSEKKAEIIKDVNTSNNIVSLSFENINDVNTLDKILNLLDEYNVKATFIVSGKEAAENNNMIQMIKNHGHEIGTTLSISKNVKNLSKEELAKAFCKSKKITQEISRQNIDIIKCKSSDYTEDFLSNAYACGFNYVVDSKKYISYQSFKNYEEANGYISRIKNGSIISVKVNGVLDKSEYIADKKQENDLSIDKRPKLSEGTYVKDNITILDTIEWLLQAISLNDKRNVILSRLPEYDGIYIKQVPKIKPYKKTIFNFSNKKFFNTIKPNNSADNNSSNSSNEESTDILKTYYILDAIKKNNGMLASDVKQFYTTEKALSYTFRGIRDEESLNNVLETLKAKNIKGTFFVTKDEIEKYPDRIKKIADYGNEIGNGGITNDSRILHKSVSEVCNEIYTVNEMLKEMNLKPKSYMPGHGYINNNIKEAVSSMKNIEGCEDYRLFTHTKAPVLSKYKEAQADYIIKDYFNTETYLSMQKGEVVYFRLDSGLFSDTKTVANMVSNLTDNYVNNGYIHRYNSETQTYDLVQKPLGYEVVPVNELNDTYKIAGVNGNAASEPISVTTGSAVNITTDASVQVTAASAVQPVVNNNTYENTQLSNNSAQQNAGLEQTTDASVKVNNSTDNSKFSNYATVSAADKSVLPERTTEAAEYMYADHYIGNNSVDLYGFTDEMKERLDKDGLINTNGESVVFLSFDDWGSDVIINEILDVLKKHNVHGSFFTISKYVDVNSGISNANPNLLRTIALEGHDIGSHTYNHDTSDTEKVHFKESVKKSYKVLHDVVGDTGTLKPMLRFPTLMTTKDGLDSVFESGLDYCISGNISTHDYQADSAQEIVDAISSELVPNAGNVIVMHMNNQAYYTPEALDIFLTNNEKGVYGTKYKVLKLGDYLH